LFRLTNLAKTGARHQIDTMPDTKPASDNQILATGARVLRTEGDALLLFAGQLSQSFVDAVEAIYAVKGRVILSGIGKSGHVARKIAATLASTGTPAYFVHPAEASHGDLGMITQGDVCLVLSNSGETAELSDIIAHTRRFGIPLIGVASRAESTLLKAADIALVLPNAPEACAIGMAPTTSTTLTLALGDALAVAVMEKRGFQPHDFKQFHPGGKLGAQLRSVESLMHSGDALPLVTPETAMADTLLVMTAKSFGVVGIVDGGKLAGIITDGDLRRNMAGLMDKSAGDVMHKGPLTIRPEALAAEALGVMNDRKITCLFVVDAEHKPVGLIHIHDCLRAGVQ
jgi:arabinose-5-phosphate isomerase